MIKTLIIVNFMVSVAVFLVFMLRISSITNKLKNEFPELFLEMKKSNRNVSESILLIIKVLLMGLIPIFNILYFFVFLTQGDMIYEMLIEDKRKNAKL